MKTSPTTKFITITFVIGIILSLIVYYFPESPRFTLIEKRVLSLLILTGLFWILISSIIKEVNVKNSKDIISGDKFMKILIACEVPYELLKDYKWTITELKPHKYHCIGDHPIAKRIDIIKSEIFIH
jgi:multisubunit Na+/H+ antiporter MnhE subunit